MKTGYMLALQNAHEWVAGFPWNHCPGWRGIRTKAGEPEDLLSAIVFLPLWSGNIEWAILYRVEYYIAQLTCVKEET